VCLLVVKLASNCCIIFLSAVKVTPRSIKHSNPNKLDCTEKDPMDIPGDDLKQDLNIIYSYSIKFVVNFQPYSKLTESN